MKPDPEDIFTVGPGMTLLEAYTKAIAWVAELEEAAATRNDKYNRMMVQVADQEEALRALVDWRNMPGDIIDLIVKNALNI